MPIRMRTIACPNDHHNTLAFVLSLTCLNLSSRAWNAKYDVTTEPYDRSLVPTDPLICLFLCDLFYLVQELSDPQLQFI